MINILERFKNSWDAFRGRDPTSSYLGMGSSYYPGRSRVFVSNIRSILSVIFNRIAVDVAGIDFRHVRLNEEGKYKEEITSTLNECLRLDPNLDQSKQAFFIDLVYSMLEEGVVAVVPVYTNADPIKTESYDVQSIRVGKIVNWYPQHVDVEVYREETGQFEIIRELPKRVVLIIENPFYAVMNEPNSTLKRLTRVLSQLDRSNEVNSSPKLDMIIKLPYLAKSKLKKAYAETRRKELEDQLDGSQLGIGYIDGNEQIVQLNRSLENNLWTQAKELTAELFNHLGLSMNVVNGTASEAELTNYHDQTIRVYCTAIVEEIERKWLSKTARSQRQAIRFFRDPFKIVPVSQLAEMSDKLTRNEIMSSNEIRAIIGLKPSDDPRADQLINANLNQEKEDPRISSTKYDKNNKEEDNEL